MKYTTLRATPKNFEEIIEKAKALLAKGDAEVTLDLAGGRYNLTKSVSMDAKDFPGESRLRFLGGNRIKTVFCSETVIAPERFVPVEGKPYYTCQLEAGEDGSYPVMRAFYVDGKLATLAETNRYRSVYPFQREDGTEYLIMQHKWEEDYDSRLLIPKAAVLEAGVDACRGAELHMRVEWEYKIYHIDHIDMDDTYTKEDGTEYVTVQVTKDEKKYGNQYLHICDRPFSIANLPSLVNAPGKYAYERATGTIYYYPEKPIAESRFAIGNASGLFILDNFDALTFRGVTLTGIADDIFYREGYYATGQSGEWERFGEGGFSHSGALRMENCGEADIDDCIFTELPCDGISMRGILKNITVRNCRFLHIGASALHMGRSEWIPDLSVDLIENLRVLNNRFDNCGFAYHNCCTMTITHVRDAKINHNTLTRSSYTALSIGWRWVSAEWQYRDPVQMNLQNVEIGYNYITSFMTGMQDGGGIYTLGGNAYKDHHALMNTLHDNVIIEDDLTCPTNGFFASIYHDGASSHWYDRDNIIVHNPARKGPHNSARIYLQRVSAPFKGSTWNQNDWNILCENNYICCVDNFGDVYRSQNFDRKFATDMLDYTRYLREKDTHLLPSVKALRKIPEAMNIWHGAGCDLK